MQPHVTTLSHPYPCLYSSAWIVSAIRSCSRCKLLCVGWPHWLFETPWVIWNSRLEKCGTTSTARFIPRQALSAFYWPGKLDFCSYRNNTWVGVVNFITSPVWTKRLFQIPWPCAISQTLKHSWWITSP